MLVPGRWYRLDRNPTRLEGRCYPEVQLRRSIRAAQRATFKAGWIGYQTPHQLTRLPINTVATILPRTVGNWSPAVKLRGAGQVIERSTEYTRELPQLP
jgi:hypothetical protein